MVTIFFYLDSEIEQSGRSDHFPEGTECTPWFFVMSAGTKLKCALKLSSPNIKKQIKTRPSESDGRFDVTNSLDCPDKFILP